MGCVKMADVSVEVMKRNKITPENLVWLVPHQANMRIIEAVARRMGIKPEQVMINIQNMVTPQRLLSHCAYGNGNLC